MTESADRPGFKIKCKDCIFFIDETSCDYHNRLGRFIQLNQVTQDSDGPTLHRVCTALRDKQWAEMMTKHGVNYDGMQKHIDNLLQIQVDILIDGYEANIEDIDTSLESVMKMSMLPKLIIVCISDDMDGYAVLSAVNKRVAGTTVKYIIVQMAEDLDNENKRLSMMALKAERQYIAYFYAGDLVPECTVSEVHRHLNVDMKQFIMIKPFGAGLSGLVIQRQLHRAIKFDDQFSVVAKVHELAEEQGRQDMIMEWVV